MTLFEEIVNESLLLEKWNKVAVEKERQKLKGMPIKDQILYAIEKVRRINFRYDDKQGGGGKNYRYILPVAIGKSKAGNIVFRAFQTAGSTKRGNKKWKLFRIDRIRDINDFDFNVSTRNFRSYKQELDRLGLHNPDKGMIEIYGVSPLCGYSPDANIKDIDMPITSEPIMKNDVSTQQTSKETPQQIKQPEKQTQQFDNFQDNTYIGNKVDAPKTEPILKSQIQEPEVPVQTSEPTATQTNKIGSEPITKLDVENEKNDKDSGNEHELTTYFKDMMNRMDNLYKDENEQKEE